MKATFNKKLYKISAIKDSVEAYSEVADFNVNEIDNIIEVEIDNVDSDLEKIIKDEFCNHVLAGMQQYR